MKDSVKLFLLILLLPLLSASVALWQEWRCTNALAELANAGISISLEEPLALELPEGLEGEPAGLGAAPEDDGAAARSLMLWSWARVLPVLAVVFSAASALLGLAGALGIFYSRRKALESQERAAAEFTLQRRRLPWICLALTVWISLAMGSLGAFELLVLAARSSLETVGSGGASLLILLIMLVLMLCRFLWTRLRQRLRDFFTVRPLELMGRRLLRSHCPALFDLVAEAAQKIGAAEPHNIMIGLDGGFFMASRPVALKNGDHLTGRTLHIWLPVLDWLTKEQFQALLIHELAFYRDGERAYSGRLLPLYQQVLRNLDRSHPDSERAFRGWLAAPVALILGFLTDAFAPVVEEWDRRRELAADRAAADALGEDTTAAALIRSLALVAPAEAALEELSSLDTEDPKGWDFRRLVERHIDQQGLSCGVQDLGQSLFFSPLPALERLQALGMVPGEPALQELCRPGRSGLLEELFASEGGRKSLSQLEEEYSHAAEVARRSLREACRSVLEQTAEDQAIFENTQLSTGASALVGLMGLCAGAALLGSRDLTGLGGAFPLLLCTLGGGIGSLIFSYHCFHRGQKAVMVLSAQGVKPRNFDLIPWSVIQDVRSVVANGTVTVTLKLQDRYIPHRIAGIQFGRPRDFVTFSGGRLKTMSWHQALQLLQLYRAAWYAHRELKR